MHDMCSEMTTVVSTVVFAQNIADCFTDEKEVSNGNDGSWLITNCVWRPFQYVLFNILSFQISMWKKCMGAIKCDKGEWKVKN